MCATQDVVAAEFDFTFSGIGTYFDTGPGYNSGPYYCPNDQYGSTSCQIPFFGDLHVVTSSGADGTYTGADVEKMWYRTNLENFSYKYGDVPQLETKKSGHEYVGLALYPSVTIQHGAVTSIDASYQFLYGVLSLGNLAIDEFNGAPYTSWQASAPLSPIPESAPALMLAGGLAILAWRRRLHGRMR
jgi:hypothetical protein